MTSRNKFLSAVLLISVVPLLGSCAAKQPLIPDPLVIPRTQDQIGSAVRTPASGIKPPTSIEETPKPPAAKKLSTVKAAAPGAAAAEPADITVAFEQMPLPNFVQAIYGVVLKKNYSMDAQVMARKDLVTLRASTPQTPAQIESAARLLLKTYGVAAIELGANNYRFVPDNTQTGYAPEILRGRALPEVPLPLRPIYQLVELHAVNSAEIVAWINTIFGKKVIVQNDASRNAIVLSGQSDDVAAALEAIHILDQPLMKGRQSIRISPMLWTVDELAKKLSEVLVAEGYYVNTTAVANAPPITLLPIQAINSIIVFAADTAILKHITDWATQLDKPSGNRGVSNSYFTYQARYTNAEALAKTMQDLLANAMAGAGSAPAAGQPAAALARPGRVVVNSATNSIIFHGNGENYSQILGLLQELDRPSKSALIEVTVAEVTLDDTTQLGVEWAFNASGAKGATIVGGTRPGIPLGAAGTTTGLGAGTGGLTIARLNSAGDLRMLLNMLATSSNANVLSSPRILARNGETATIQVGSEIPTINQQQTNAATAGTGVLQSVQYRNTGVILKVKPLIYAGDRIDLDVTQEVSDSTRVGAAGSPIIDTRKVDTHLSLKDGTPILLGGLMSQNNSRTESGVPLLKDIPGIGQLFRTNTDNNRKTELLILITPYIVADDHDAQAVTDAFRNQLGEWAHSKNTPPLTNEPHTAPQLNKPAALQAPPSNAPIK